MSKFSAGVTLRVLQGEKDQSERVLSRCLFWLNNNLRPRPGNWGRRLGRFSWRQIRMRKLLVVNDQPGITTVVSLIAQQLGIDCMVLNSSAKATETFIEYRPDILMLDMIMPEKD